MTEVKLILTNSLGLHARPAAKITKIASKYKSDIVVSGNNRSADAKSISMLMTMGVPKGNEIVVSVNGPDEKECIEELKNLIENKFFED